MDDAGMWLLTMTIMLFIMINRTVTITYHNENFVATIFFVVIKYF